MVEHLGTDGRLGLHVGDWVELVVDQTDLGNSAEDAPEAPDKPGRLLQVAAIDPIDLKVTLGLPKDDISRSYRTMTKRQRSDGTRCCDAGTIN